jgi:GMP synthase-like glutamine amidotransferase
MIGRSLLVVQNAEHEDLGLLAAPFARLGFRARVVRAFAGEPVPMQLDADALVVMGGGAHVYDPSTGPWMGDVMRLLRRTHERKPILGVCLGAQLAAHALGGRATPGPQVEAGFERVDPAPAAAEDPVLSFLRAGDPAFSLHGDTYTLPSGAVRLASSKRYEEQAFRLGRATYGLQFHVDLTPATLRTLLHEDEEGLAAVGIDAEALLREVERRAPEMEALAAKVPAGFAKLWE